MSKITKGWIEVKGFEGSYEINWSGEVRSIDRMYHGKFRKGRTLKQSMNSKGSPQVVLLKDDGKRRTVRIYTLMIESFPLSEAVYDYAERFIKKGDSPGRGKSYEFRSPEGDHVRVHNLSQFCKEEGLHVSNMCQVAAGKLGSCKGWKRFVRE